MRSFFWTAPVVLVGCGFGELSDSPNLASVEQKIIGDYRTQVLSLGPVGYWRLGERTGNTVMNDSSTAGINGTYNSPSNPGMGIRGALGYDYDTAVSFSGSSYYGEVPDHKTLSLTRDWDNFDGADNGSSTTWGTAPGGESWTCNLSCALT